MKGLYKRKHLNPKDSCLDILKFQSCRRMRKSMFNKKSIHTSLSKCLPHLQGNYSSLKKDVEFFALDIVLDSLFTPIFKVYVPI